MNPLHEPYQFTPQLAQIPWAKVFSREQPPPIVIDLIDNLLRYNPTQRRPPLKALQLQIFDILRLKELEQFRSQDLFNFLPEEFWFATEEDKQKLIPTWYAAASEVT